MDSISLYSSVTVPWYRDFPVLDIPWNRHLLALFQRLTDPRRRIRSSCIATPQTLLLESLPKN